MLCHYKKIGLCFWFLREKSTASAVLVYWIKMVHIEIHKLWQLKIKVYLKYVRY